MISDITTNHYTIIKGYDIIVVGAPSIAECARNKKAE